MCSYSIYTTSPPNPLLCSQSPSLTQQPIPSPPSPPACSNPRPNIHTTNSSPVPPPTVSQKYTNPFPAPKRFITTHDPAGKAIIDTSFGEEMPITVIKGGEVDFGLGFTTSSFPVSFADDADLSVYGGHVKTGPGIAVPTGTVMRIVTMAPGHVSPMHRTSSLDYGVVLEGECELVLDSGETRLMKRGDTSVQRGTNHAWRNASDKEWCRMLYVVIGAEAAVVNGKKLEEDTNGAEQGQTGDLQK